MAFEFYIEDTLVDQPSGDLDLSTKIRRDDEIGGMVITQEATLTWHKDNDVTPGYTSGYTTLKDLFDSGICNEAIINVYSRVSNTETYLVSTGVLKVPQFEFDEQTFSVSTKIQDNSYYSYIKNNRNLKVDFRAFQTKNKFSIDVLRSWSVDFYNGCTGVRGSTVGALYKGYAATDILEFIIAVITDNKVSFQSDYLTDSIYPLYLFKGESLLNAYTLYPTSDPTFEVSLQDILTELDKEKNLYFYIDSSDPDAPIFRLERREDTFSQQIPVTITEPLEIKTTVYTAKLYGKVRAGSDITVDGSNTSNCIYTMNEAISYYGFKVEEFFPLGQCNTDTELDLVNNWIVSNNVIQDIIVNQSESYMDNYILVECDNIDEIALTADARKWDFYGQAAPPYFYNLGLNNYAKLQRHSSKFETSFGNFLGLGSLGFKALLGDDPVQDETFVTGPASASNFIPFGGLTFQAAFVNESTNGGFDGSNNYDNVNFEYTVPQDGDYSFHICLNLEVTGLSTPAYFEVSAGMIQYDAFLVQKAASGTTDFIFPNGLTQVNDTLVANCVAGDIIQAFYTIIYRPNGVGPAPVVQTITIMYNSYWECNGTPEGGITITAGNQTIQKLLHDMEYHFTDTEWRTILSNPTGVLPFVKDEVTRYGWIQDMTRNEQTGQTKIKLISSNASA